MWYLSNSKKKTNNLLKLKYKYVYIRYTSDIHLFYIIIITMTINKEVKSSRVIMNIPAEMNDTILNISKKIWVSKTSIYKLMISLWLQIYGDIENLSYLLDNKKQDDNINL